MVGKIVLNIKLDFEKLIGDEDELLEQIKAEVGVDKKEELFQVLLDSATAMIESLTGDFLEEDNEYMTYSFTSELGGEYNED